MGHLHLEVQVYNRPSFLGCSRIRSNNLTTLFKVWFLILDMLHKIKSNIHQLDFKEFSSAVYLIQINNQNILIDTGSTLVKQELLEDLKQLNILPEKINIIIQTHSHYDHIENNNLFKNAKIYTKENINQLPIKEFKIILVPGHTQDSIAILYNKILFSGDTIFHNKGIGRTDFQESEPEKIQESIDKLHLLDFDILCPGHN